MEIKFSYKNEWRHLPYEEIYEAQSEFEMNEAITQFRQRHDSYGAVLIFGSNDGLDWNVIGESNGNKDFQCVKCSKYFIERLLLRFEDEIVCFNCWKLYK